MSHYDKQFEKWAPGTEVEIKCSSGPVDVSSKLKDLLGQLYTEHSHYKKGTIQPAEYIAAHDMNFFIGCVVKYVSRYRDSMTGKEDLFDAINYLMMEIAHTYGEAPDDIIRVISGKLPR